MRPAPTRLPLLQCTKAGRLPASSRTASNSRPNVASLTAPCPIGMLTYSRPAWTRASGVLNGRGSIASRRSITTSHPARFSAARCSDAGCPPVTIPWIGSQALGTPAMASRSWLIGIAAASFRGTIYLNADRYGFAPPPLAARSPEAAPQAVARLGRGISHGAALPALPRRRRSRRDDPCGGAGRRLGLSHPPPTHPRDGAGGPRPGAGPPPPRGAAPPG